MSADFMLGKPSPENFNKQQWANLLKNNAYRGKKIQWLSKHLTEGSLKFNKTDLNDQKIEFTYVKNGKLKIISIPINELKEKNKKFSLSRKLHQWMGSKKLNRRIAALAGELSKSTQTPDLDMLVKKRPPLKTPIKKKKITKPKVTKPLTSFVKPTVSVIEPVIAIPEPVKPIIAALPPKVEVDPEASLIKNEEFIKAIQKAADPKEGEKVAIDIIITSQPFNQISLEVRSRKGYSANAADLINSRRMKADVYRKEDQYFVKTGTLFASLFNDNLAHDPKDEFRNRVLRNLTG